MKRTKTVAHGHVVLIALATAVSGLALSTSAFSNGALHHVQIGGADSCNIQPGCDKNFSLSATQFADGSVKGQLIDRFGGGGGDGIQATIDCLLVADYPFGGQIAWVSGTITKGQFQNAAGNTVDVAGQPVWTAALDWGTSSQDVPDIITFSYIGDSTPCYEHPDPTAIGFLRQGQVTIW